MLSLAIAKKERLPTKRMKNDSRLTFSKDFSTWVRQPREPSCGQWVTSLHQTPKRRNGWLSRRQTSTRPAPAPAAWPPGTLVPYGPPLRPKCSRLTWIGILPSPIDLVYLRIQLGPGATTEGGGNLGFQILPVMATGWYSVMAVPYLSPWHARARAQSLSSWDPVGWENNS